MSQVVIENPIINSPFAEPTRHFRFTDEGITNEEVDGRRTSSYFILIAKERTPAGFRATERASDR
jgi:type III restriction enzyme